MYPDIGPLPIPKLGLPALFGALGMAAGGWAGWWRETWPLPDLCGRLLYPRIRAGAQLPRYRDNDRSAHTKTIFSRLALDLTGRPAVDCETLSNLEILPTSKGDGASFH